MVTRRPKNGGQFGSFDELVEMLTQIQGETDAKLHGFTLKDYMITMEILRRTSG